jgi:hypothetical protein
VAGVAAKLPSSPQAGICGSAACWAERLRLSAGGLGPDQPPPLGWKAQPSSLAKGGGGCEHGRKARGFPHSKRQSRVK